jgi:hypothetical protein
MTEYFGIVSLENTLFHRLWLPLKSFIPVEFLYKLHEPSFWSSGLLQCAAGSSTLWQEASSFVLKYFLQLLIFKLIFINLRLSYHQSSFEACHYWRNRGRKINHWRPSCKYNATLCVKGGFFYLPVPLVLTSCRCVSSERKDGEGTWNNAN